MLKKHTTPQQFLAKPFSRLPKNSVRISFRRSECFDAARQICTKVGQALRAHVRVDRSGSRGHVRAEPSKTNSHERRMVKQGTPRLYDEAFEHDSCGFGIVAQIDGQLPARLLVDQRRSPRYAEAVPSRCERRWRVSGDGCGVLLRRPVEWLRALAGEAGISLATHFACGVVFLDPDGDERRRTRARCRARHGGPQGGGLARCRRRCLRLRVRSPRPRCPACARSSSTHRAISLPPRSKPPCSTRGAAPSYALSTTGTSMWCRCRARSGGTRPWRHRATCAMSTRI